MTIVRIQLQEIIDAIEGTIIMTPEIVNAIDAIATLKVPRKWTHDKTSAEIAWLAPNLASWIKGLKDRYYQLNSWYVQGRPASYWLTGFFNPQGFLTALRQEITRMKKKENWSLDEVEQTATVLRDKIIKTDDGKININITPPNDGGCYIHGLFLEGAKWGK